jgi:hypothetical protein
MHIRIEGTLDYRQHKQHIPFAFTVPDRATRLAIQFDYAPKQSQGQPVQNDLSLTLFDPQGARGARHCNPDRNLVLTEHSASPGYTAGALRAGTWTVWIDAHRVMPPDPINYWFEIEISDMPQVETPAEWVKPVLESRGPGWYRGDLHGHTCHSDADWDVPDIVQYGHEYQLDFVSLTDHNTISPLAQMDSLATESLLTMGGMELTTYYGHALALGVRQWQEWRIGLNGLTMPDLAQRVMDNGGLFIIAHPHSIGDPYCTGCDWQYADMMPGNARCVEIWNGPWDGDSGNEQALQRWFTWLNAGYRMVATAGTDIHGPLNDPAPGFNVVYAEDRSEQAILQAIRHGHLYLSAGPRLEFTAGDAHMMGDYVTDETVHFTLRWQALLPSDVIAIIVDGQPNQTVANEATGSYQWSLPVAGRMWCAVQIRGADGRMRAITNPIFMGSAWA